MSLLRNIVSKFQKSSYRVSNYCTAVNNSNSDKVKNEEIEPIISRKEYQDEKSLYQKPREVWLENIDTVEEKKLGLLTLHPDVYGAAPRIDVIHQNVRWQMMYRYVNYAHTKTRAEMRGGGRKPHPQKGMGKARAGSIRSPLWRGGGIAHGPRSPTPHFYMLSFYARIAGLTATLSVKLAQDDLHVVDSLEIPTQEPSYILDMLETRNWGPSVLFVDTEDIMPENITMACDRIKHVNLMPVYGLNVYSMLKHSTLVLTQRAVRSIEDKILFHHHRTDAKKLMEKFQLNQQ